MSEPQHQVKLKQPSELFLQITPEEQLRRFQERLRNPMKRWKLTEEDLRNRSRWDEYANAYETMFARTSTCAAPWTVIPGDKKWTARVRILEEVVPQLGKGLDVEPPALDLDLVRQAEEQLGITVEP